MNFLRRLWRKAFFSDMSALVALGSTRALQVEDFPQLPADLDPRDQRVDAGRIDWLNGRRLLLTMSVAMKRYWLLPTILFAIDVALNLAGPVLVNGFVKRLQVGLSTNAELLWAVAYGVAIGASGLVAGLSIQHYFYHSLRRMQVAVNIVNTRIFHHALKLTKSARERIPVGDIVNHMSTDTDSVAEFSSAVSEIVFSLTMIFGAIGLLFYYVGSTAWVAVALLVTLVPITRKVSRDLTRFDDDLMKHRDDRISLMSQILSAIRLVKYFGWEKSVESEVHAAREAELTARRRIAKAQLIVTLIYVTVGTFILFSVLAVHAWRGYSMDAALIFTCVSIFSLLEDPFANLSRQISMLIGADVGAARIAKFLNEPVLANDFLGQAKRGGPLGLVLRDFNAYVGEERYPALKGLNLRIPPGQSLAVVGPVGSGKSTLIHALLGETEASEGEFYFIDENENRQGVARIGYVPQEAYIMNGSLRENLFFGNEGLTDADLRRAVHLSGLESDIGRMTGGWATEIGEKGINLSGGQRQRLSLARAILHRPQLVILDDPLSAVDPGMENHLVTGLLFGEWKHVTRVVITHRLESLSRFDRIAFLDEGRLAGTGTFAELKASCAKFRDYVEEYARTHSADHAAKLPVAEEKADLAVEARITEDEDRESGAVRGGLYWEYIWALGGGRRILIALLALAAASGTVFPLVQKSWLAYVSNVQSNPAWKLSPLGAIYVYGALGILVLVGTLLADLFWLRRGLLAGKNLHDGMLRSLLGAKIRFFDSTPVGRVLQRFSRDTEAVDIHLQWCFEHSVKSFVQLLITFTLIVVVLPWVLVLIAPVLLVYYRVQKLYRSSSREAKRLDSISRSPRFAHFKETLSGLVVIRAFAKREWFIEEFYARLAHSQRMFYGHYMINRWFSSRIPVVGGIVSLCTALAIVAAVRMDAISAGTAALLTVYSLNLWGVLNWGIRVWSDVEARMTSMERVKHYSDLPQEKDDAQWTRALENWPRDGAITFENVSARYAENLPRVLRGLSFRVGGGEKVGIVGRTGSGKSTLFQALYRFLEIESGRILIDGLDITTIPLGKLRKALAIIPQDPVLFLGSIRANLDRYGEFHDEQIWQVLERTRLAALVRGLAGGLEARLTENGANLSQGQRQLLCLARALLLKAKIVILDEATASVDVQTDGEIQRIIRESCANVTMLIIAHRLGTLQGCDQILEIREGRLVENSSVEVGAIV